MPVKTIPITPSTIQSITSDYLKRVTLAGVFLLISAVAAADLPTGKPQRAGFDPDRLARIDARMSEAVAAGIMVGGQAAIAKDGKVIYRQVWGDADREAGTPMQEDTLYRIYSMTKPITGVALMMLYEEGRFLLEDPVSMYLPELANLKLVSVDENGEPVEKAPMRQPSIRDLLRHTAGMSYGIFSNTPVDLAYREAELLQAPTLEEFTKRLGQLPLLLEPGTRWHYSVSVDVQGRLVEVLSGMPFGEFLDQRIFGPLGMEDTFFVVPEDKQDRLAQLYSPKGTVMNWNEPWQFSTETELEPADPRLTEGYLKTMGFESGGGGLVSSTDDYLKFAQMLVNEGEYNGTRLLAPGTIELMTGNHIQGMDSSGLWRMDAFGLGVGVVQDPSAVSGELGPSGTYGWGGAAGTLFWVDPENDLTAVFMVQSVPHQTPLSRRFKVLTYQALVED